MQSRDCDVILLIPIHDPQDAGSTLVTTAFSCGHPGRLEADKEAGVGALSGTAEHTSSFLVIGSKPRGGPDDPEVQSRPAPLLLAFGDLPPLRIALQSLRDTAQLSRPESSALPSLEAIIILRPVWADVIWCLRKCLVHCGFLYYRDFIPVCLRPPPNSGCFLLLLADRSTCD